MEKPPKRNSASYYNKEAEKRKVLLFFILAELFVKGIPVNVIVIQSGEHAVWIGGQINPVVLFLSPGNLLKQLIIFIIEAQGFPPRSGDLSGNQFNGIDCVFTAEFRDKPMNNPRFFRVIHVQGDKLTIGVVAVWAQENLNIQKESLENAKSRWTQSEINYKNGMIPRLSMLNAKVTYENKRPAVLSAEQSLKQSKDTFAFLLGMPYGQDIELVGGIEFSYIDVDADELYNKYVEQNYEIQSLKKNIQTLKMGINATNLSVFTPALAVSWNLTPVVIDKDSNWFDKDNTFDNGSLSITLAFKNLFDMLPCSSSMQKAKDMKQQLEQAELGLEQLYQNAENEVHKLADTLVVSKENIEAMERNVSMAQDAYEATLKAYNAGTQERLELQDSEQQLNQAKLGLMNEKFNYISALLDLETKLNIKLR